jgi:glycosyltransferase involved in cell wall biosynthesis
MKIAFIPSTFLPYVGGAETQTHNVANCITERKNDVDIYVLKNTKIQNANYNIIRLNRFLISFVFILRYYLNINLDFFLKVYFSNIQKKKKYDIWHFHSVNYKTLIYVNVLNSLNQKVIITFQGGDIQVDEKISYGYRLDRKYELYLKSTLKKVNVFHAISKSIKDELIKLGADEKKILIIPNCSSLKKIESIPKGNNSKKITLLTIGRYAIKKKGFDLVEKISKNLNKIVDFKWIIIGRGTSSLLRERYIKENLDKFEIVEEIKNLEERYFPHSDLIKYYKKSNVYINLSRVEGCPIVLLDALSSKIPVVSFNTLGGDEIVINNINGYLVNENDFEVFAKKIVDSKNLDFKKNLDEITKKINFYDLELNTQKIISSYRGLL